MDKMVKTLLLFAVSLTAQADTFSIRTNVLRNVPVPDTVEFRREQNSSAINHIGYEPTSGVHVAYYSGGLSNILVWTDGTWKSNKFINGLTGDVGMALTTNRIYGISRWGVLHEFTWPDGTFVTNVPVNANSIMGPPIAVTATNKMVIVASLAAAAGCTDWFYRNPITGIWNFTNICYTASSASQPSFCQGPDQKIYTHYTIDANQPVIKRLWETNGVLEFVDGATNYLFNSWGLEQPRVVLYSDPYRNKVVAFLQGQRLSASDPTQFDASQFNLGSCDRANNPVFVGITNNLATNNIGSLDIFCHSIFTSTYAVIGTNSYQLFTDRIMPPNNCVDNIFNESRWLFTTTNYVGISNRRPYALSSDGWILYRGPWREWILDKVVPP